jgi:hypothetical protein
MQIIQLLSAATAFSIILLEVYSGVIQGPLWWVWPGGLVLALLIALSQYAPELIGAAKPPQAPRAVSQIIQLIFILAVAFGASYFSNYFGRSFIPDLLTARGWAAPTPWPPQLFF